MPRPRGPAFVAFAGVDAAAYGAVSVTAATQILAVNRDRRSFTLIHDSTDTLYLGFDSGVTTANGYPLLGNQPYSSHDYDGAVWGVSSGGAISVRYQEF
jgi:hypothetical protein